MEENNYIYTNHISQLAVQKNVKLQASKLNEACDNDIGESISEKHILYESVTIMIKIYHFHFQLPRSSD